MISSDHQSPNESRDLAIGHSAFSKLVRFTIASSGSFAPDHGVV
jgi:hypothetical protein